MLQSLCGVDFNKTLAGQLTKSSTHFQASQVVGWRPLEGVFSTISKMGIKQKIAIESKSMPPLCLVLSLCDDDGTALLHIANGMKRYVFNIKCNASSNIEFYASSIITYIAILVLFTNSSNFQANGLNTALLAKIFNAKTLQYIYMLQIINHKIFKGY